MPQYTQANRPLRFDSNLGQDLLLPSGFSGVEGISMPFSFQIDLLSEDPAVSAEKLLRTPVVLTIALRDGGERKVHGVVSRFLQLGQREELVAYQAEIVPWLWFLSLSRDCRIFQNLNVIEIVEEVFRTYGYSDFRVKCTRSYPKREYCVQYREMHLDFVSRLLEEEGIFYYFEHSDAGHTLILADDNSSMDPCPGVGGGIRVTEAPGPDEEVVSEFRQEHAVHVGMVTLNHYDFQQPALGLTSSISGAGREEVYDYPGKHTTREEGDRVARLRLEAAEALGQVSHGTGNCPGFQSGARFELREHYRVDVNQAYALLEVRHYCTAAAFRSWDSSFEYRNEFTAIPATVPYRPAARTRKPVVSGSQTALVVGKKGEEIWTDKYGRVKVQFYWDREGKRNEDSSCWIRVSSAWAGKGWGAVQIPRVGQEVVVDFLEGDPDQPIITGRVYNAEQMPPYELPANQTQSGVKTRSTKQGGTDHFNELRFEDKKGEEEIVLHAERNLAVEVEADESRTVGHDRETVVQNDDKKVVKEGDDLTAVEKGAHEIKVLEGDQRIIIERGGQTIEVIQGDQVFVVGDNQRVTVDGDQEATVRNGDQQITVEKGNQAVTLKQGDQTIEIKMGNQTTKVGMGDLKTQVSLGKITYEAMQGIEFKVGQNSIKIDQTGITIKGMMVSIDGQIKTEVKGLMAEVSGTGMLQVKGGIVMIN